VETNSQLPTLNSQLPTPPQGGNPVKLVSGQIVAERYEIDDVIGSGGMSVVYRAHDKRLDRYVTLKVLKEDYLADDNLIERFPKEARAAAALSHQNIVGIYDHGRDGDIMYIVLEYIDGASLKELINKKSPFDDETNLGVAIQISEGLSEAHANNIIHLDIKPQNILITTSSIVKVADFGIARAAKSVTLNAAAGSMGSVHYFSPEQARGGYIDQKSDIYSLGIVMFEMATGRLPFEGDNEVSVALQHINDPLPEILRFNPNVSESVVRIINKATEKSASKRYQHIDDMTEDLKRALTDASGDFVNTEKPDDQPTRTITKENQEAVRRAKLRRAFLDGEDSPEEDQPVNDGGFELVSAHGVINHVRDTREDDEPEYEPDYVPEYVPEPDYELTEEFYDEYANPAPTARDKQADTVATYGGIILGIVLAAGIGLLAWYLFTRVLSSEAGMVQVPDVTGQSWARAEMQMRTMRFVPIREDSYCGVEFACEDEYCEGDCAGQVIAQRVDPEIMRTPGDAIGIIVSLGAFAEEEEYPENGENGEEPDITSDGYTEVPRLVGLTEGSAFAVLREHNLFGNIEARPYSDSFPAGQVISSDPAPGERLEIDSMVNLLISAGPETPITIQQPVVEETPVEEPADVAPAETEDVPPAEDVPPTEDTPPVEDTPPDTPADAPPAPPVFASGTLGVVLPPDIPADMATVTVYIQRITPDGEISTVINSSVPRTSFEPALSVPVQYQTPTRFLIHFLNPDGNTIRTLEDNR